MQEFSGLALLISINTIVIIVVLTIIDSYNETSLNKQLNKISMNLDELLAKVQAQKVEVDKIVALLKATPAIDPVKAQAIADIIDANTKEISDAVAANTPATT